MAASLHDEAVDGGISRESERVLGVFVSVYETAETP